MFILHQSLSPSPPKKVKKNTMPSLKSLKNSHIQATAQEKQVCFYKYTKKNESQLWNSFWSRLVHHLGSWLSRGFLFKFPHCDREGEGCPGWGLWYEACFRDKQAQDQSLQYKRSMPPIEKVSPVRKSASPVEDELDLKAAYTIARQNSLCVFYAMFI